LDVSDETEDAGIDTETRAAFGISIAPMFFVKKIPALKKSLRSAAKVQ
jgi:hypothetical protein